MNSSMSLEISPCMPRAESRANLGAICSGKLVGGDFATKVGNFCRNAGAVQAVKQNHGGAFRIKK